MASVGHNIARAIRLQAWLEVIYKNRRGEVTHYWVGIHDIDVGTAKISGDSMHLMKLDCRYLTLRLDSIQAAEVVEGSYYPAGRRMAERLKSDEELLDLLGEDAHIQTLDYLYDCALLNDTAYVRDFGLVPHIDVDSFALGAIRLDEDQFRSMVRILSRGKRRTSSFTSKRIAMNLISMHLKEGLFVLAYRELRLDVKDRLLVIGRNTILNEEFFVGVEGARSRLSIRRFLAEDEQLLLEDFDANRETISDLIASKLGRGQMVDEEPHVFEIVRQAPLFLKAEYEAIRNLELEGTAPAPIEAFFGRLLAPPETEQPVALALIKPEANLDQLLACDLALRSPVTYVQGPPGTGKTATIVNTIVNAFVNGRTVLFCSQNNHPVDGVTETLSKLSLDGEAVPFPILRLGNLQKVAASLDHIRELLETYRAYPLDRNIARPGLDLEHIQAFEAVLEEYAVRIELTERLEAIECLSRSNTNLNFTVELETKQAADVRERLRDLREIDVLTDEAHRLNTQDTSQLLRFIKSATVFRIQLLETETYRSLLEIVYSEDDDRPARFTTWLQDPQNLKALLHVFPVVATTNMSARRLGAPEPVFDLTIIDEASQCDTALALPAIVRGRRLMLVGDPQQLSPVVLLDESDNRALMRIHEVAEPYDFCKNSLYKAYLALDAVSREILLREHYRCDERIIAFNNKKYYANRLVVKSAPTEGEALSFIDVRSGGGIRKNEAPAEADAVVDYVKDHQDASVGVITPFKAQADLISRRLAAEGLADVPCGTVHTFQGDEKDTILFSMALTGQTAPATYSWLTNNRELINVATSRAKDRLVLVADSDSIDRLHATVEGTDDAHELANYVRTQGTSKLTPVAPKTRALGIKPYTNEVEQAFLESLNHALGNIFLAGTKHVVRNRVDATDLFGDHADPDLFEGGTLDFCVFEERGGKDLPVLAIQLQEPEVGQVGMRRKQRRQDIAQSCGVQLIHVDATYARRYHYIKDILTHYFQERA